jgi:hypothetical protein
VIDQATREELSPSHNCRYGAREKEHNALRVALMEEFQEITPTKQAGPSVLQTA